MQSQLETTEDDDRGTDVMTRTQRSRCMSRIRGKDTGPELSLRKALWHRGLRYRLKSRLPGHPDIVYPSSRIAVFVDGCFWHSCPEHSVSPKNNADSWKTKLDGNRNRDAKVNAELSALGWTVIRIWEHEIKSDVEAAADRVQSMLKGEKNR